MIHLLVTHQLILKNRATLLQTSKAYQNSKDSSGNTSSQSLANHSSEEFTDVINKN